MTGERIRFLNTEIDNLMMTDALQEIERLSGGETTGYVVTPNVDHIVRLEKDAAFRQAYRQADLILADGKPLLWISKWLKTPIREKVSGSDLFPQVCRMAAQTGRSLYFLGAAPGVADLAAEKLRAQYPTIQIRGCYSPPRGFEKDKEELLKIREKVRAAQPDILILALGTPKQELFIYQNRDLLGVPVTLCLGAAIDFAAGKAKRAPRWMQQHGLEWLYRLIREPRRMFKRYLIDDLQILGIILKYGRGAGKHENRS